MSDTLAVQNADSWADMVRSIDKERKQLPWDPATTQPVQRVSNYVRKRQEREFDPVAMKFRNPEKEAQIDMQRTAQLDARITRVETMKQKNFNIISHEGPPRRIESLPSLTRDHSAQRSYHMLSNMPKNLHHDAPTLYDEKFSLSVYKETIRPRATTSTGNRREFNIISNDYFENPVEKKREEYEKLKAHVLDKYWKTHDFDIVKGRYCSPEKESRYQEQAKIMQEVQGRALERTLPSGVEYADGHSFNILTHEVYDDSRLQATNTMEQRQLNRIKKRQVELAQRTAGEEAYAAEETRRLARISRQKYDSACDAGFNPITNERMPTNRPQPLPERPPSMWARITMTPGTSSSNNVNNNNASYDAQFHHSRLPTAAADANNASGVFLDSRIDETARFRDLSGGGAGESEHYNSHRSERPPMGNRNASQILLSGRQSQQQQQQQGTNSQSSFAMLPQPVSGSLNRGPSKPASSGSLGNKKIPSLDISRADFGEPVAYQEPPNKAPPGATVAMVRTGGLSSYR